MKVLYLADADFNKAILTGLLRRDPLIDFRTALAADLGGKKDPDVLAIAAASQRVLVSHDVGTMPQHFRAFRQAGHASPGVFMVSQSLDIGRAIDELHLIWFASDPVEWQNRLVWLPL